MAGVITTLAGGEEGYADGDSLTAGFIGPTSLVIVKMHTSLTGSIIEFDWCWVMVESLQSLAVASLVTGLGAQ